VVVGTLSVSAVDVVVEARPALVIRPPAIAERVAWADAIVIGKVESIEDKTVTASSHLGGENKIEYYVAVVKVEDAVLNAKGLTHVKVAFQVPPPVQPGGIRPIRGMPLANLAKDQEVCLILANHPTESFLVLNNGFQVFDKKNANYENDVKEIKRVAKLLEKPDESLKSKDADERLLAAAMLLLKYRTPVAGSTKTEEIDAEESKRILSILAETDWSKIDGNIGLNLQPSFLFGRLNLTEKDGWKQPQDPANLDEQRQKWLKEHAATYRIQRYVADKSGGEKKEEK
jgi:hypothetical protein